jgi:hypothetical protein
MEHGIHMEKSEYCNIVQCRQLQTTMISLRAFGYKLSNNVEQRKQSLIKAMEATNTNAVIDRLRYIKQYQAKNEGIINCDIIFCYLTFHRQHEAVLQEWINLLNTVASELDDIIVIQPASRIRTMQKAFQLAMQNAA